MSLSTASLVFSVLVFQAHLRFLSHSINGTGNARHTSLLPTVWKPSARAQKMTLWGLINLTHRSVDKWTNELVMLVWHLWQTNTLHRWWLRRGPESCGDFCTNSPRLLQRTSRSPHTLPQLVAVLRHFSFFSHFRLTSRKAFLGRKYEKEITQKHFSHFLILYKCITVWVHYD